MNLKKNPSATHHIGGQNFTEWWSPYMFLENRVGGAAAAAQPCMILEFFWTFGYFRYKFFLCVHSNLHTEALGYGWSTATFI